MKGFKDTTRVQYFKGGQVTREKACGGMVKRAEGGSVKIVKNPKSGMTRKMVKEDGKWVRDPVEMKVWEDIRDRDRKDIDKLGVSFNGVKVYPKDKEPSKLDKMAGAEAVSRQNRLGVANRGFDSETGTGLKKPLKKDDGRPLARAEGGKVTKDDGYFKDLVRIDGKLRERPKGYRTADEKRAQESVEKSARNIKRQEDAENFGKQLLGGVKSKYAEGGKVDMKQDKKTVAAGVHKHERNMHPGKPLTKMQRGGFPAHNRAPMIKAK